MKIKRLISNGFRGLPDRTFDFTSPRTGAPADIVVVTGPSGSGKTSLLEAIIAAKEDVGPYGLKRSSNDFVRPGEAAAKVRVDWVLSQEERARVGATGVELSSESIFAPNLFSSIDHDPSLVALLGEYDVDPAVSKVEYFHANRRIPRGGAPSIATLGVPEAERLARLTQDDAKYALVSQYIAEANLGLHDKGGTRGAERLAEAFGRLCRTRQLAGVEQVGRAIVPRFADARGTVVGLEGLSDTAKQALLFAVTFLRSGIEGSLVLIDTPELHIPEPEVGAFVAALARMGLDNQLVLATGSPGVVAGNPDALVVPMS
ncbi:AAA family ATPase [Polyangium spumosum]|uniref:AAA family ATPase n=1 Tax=Polyangium spumosum TaxID=889282 RepID=A0A6N7PLT1_9BACT|nr:AAA family ATPase [Polyangium spumosum]MRG92978.1 AAA family ATPase [Polyangium spumosum]